MADPTKPRYAFEEYKLLYESTERVIDRRLSNNRWNYSVCVAVLVADTVLFDRAFGVPRFFFLGLASVLTLSALGFSFTLWWLRQISDSKSLNNAKFEVLNEMATAVVFAEIPSAESYRPFEKEWRRLEDRGKLVKIKVLGRKIKALKSSKAEYFIPKGLMVLFVLVGLYDVVTIARNWEAFCRSAAAVELQGEPNPSESP